jgi:aspartate aminotransferase
MHWRRKQQARRSTSLNIGQPDIQTPEAYRAALRTFSDDVLSYAPSPGVPALIDAIRAYYRKLDVSFDPEDILITTGGSEALDILMKCILDEGSEIIAAEPFYPNYHTFIRAAGGRIVPIPSTPEDGYRYAVREKIEPLITERTRAILVTNPGNPTGTVLTPEELRLLTELAAAHGLYLVCDEVYREFVYNGEALQTVGRFTDAAENIVLVDSVSKRFSACGARIGALISKNHTLMGQAMKFAQGRLSVASIDQAVATALYSVPDGYFSAIRDEYRRRRDICFQKLQRIPGVVCVEPMGAFYMMAKLPVDDTDRFQQWLLEKFDDHGETVMFSPGASFYATAGCGTQEIRIAYVLQTQKLARAIDLLGIAIARYNRETAGA